MHSHLLTLFILLCIHLSLEYVSVGVSLARGSFYSVEKGRVTENVYVFMT